MVRSHTYVARFSKMVKWRNICQTYFIWIMIRLKNYKSKIYIARLEGTLTSEARRKKKKNTLKVLQELSESNLGIRPVWPLPQT